MNVRQELTVLIVLFPGLLFGQDNRRCKEIGKGKVFSDRQIIAVETIFVPGVEDSLLTIHVLGKNQFVIESPVLSITHQVCYRVFPAFLNHVFSTDTLADSSGDSTTSHPTISAVNRLAKPDELFDLGDISSSGRLTRGISVGNTQDLFVNSSLNLNLEGNLTENLKIHANITDESVPYQPEGNTQRLQDFDNAYLELYNDNFSITGGDVIFQSRDNYFMKYRKSVVGGQIKVRSKKHSSYIGFSSAKGQFASARLPVSDGVSGPYKIPSVGNQAFIIIVANSEKVFLDGKLLTRGYDQDYVIDYNQAEISFTSKVMPTRYSRVRVEYEYSLQNFARSIVSVGHQQKLGKSKINIDYYKESDNKNRPLIRPLTLQEKLQLREAGNDPALTLAPGYTQVPWDANQILYYQQDTVDQTGKAHSVFIHATSSRPQIFAVTFTKVGQYKGSYDIAGFNAQGRFYAWVGENKGNYAPVIPLPVPTKKEMVSLRATVPAGPYGKLSLETAFSSKDDNLYSDMDDGSNGGYAARSVYEIQQKPVSWLKNYSLSMVNSVEFVQRNFNSIDRFRKIEFDRDWSFSSVDSARANDFLVDSHIVLSKDENNKFGYQVAFRHRPSQLCGWQNRLEVKRSLGKFQLNTSGSFMHSNKGDQSSDWEKANAETYFRGKIQPGYRINLEHNLERLNISDSLVGTANYFTSHEFFVRNNPSSKTQFELAYQIRDDKIALGGSLDPGNETHFLRAHLSTTTRNNNHISIILNYRILQDHQNHDDSRSLSGQVDWKGDLIPNVLHNELNYSISNARVPKREYVYVEVPTGQGTHTWKDLNQDGVKDLNEFFEAVNFDEKNFIRVLVPVNNFLDAFENTFNYNTRLTFPQSWTSGAGLKKLLSKISNVTSWSSHYRTTQDDIKSRLIPFLTSIDGENLLSLKKAMRTTFFFNRTDPQYGVITGYALKQRKILYTNGFEGRNDREYTLTLRWNMSTAHTFKINSLHAYHLNESDYLKERNYSVMENKIGPMYSWQPSPQLRLSTGYALHFKKEDDTSESKSSYMSNEVSGQLKIGVASKFMLEALVKMSMIEFQGKELSALGYEMLQGLRAGNNYTWSLGWQQKLINGLQINFYYEGRKPEASRVIHTGRFSVSALF